MAEIEHVKYHNHIMTQHAPHKTGRFAAETISRIEAAARLGISTRKLDTMLADRKIGHIRLGGRILFRSQDLDALLARCFVPAKGGVE